MSFFRATSCTTTQSSKRVVFKHTRFPLKKPFLKELQSVDPKIYEAGLFSFSIIQTYMGDVEKVPPALKNAPTVFLTDLLFGTAIDCPLLRDEVYIQLMNQLSMNPKK